MRLVVAQLCVGACLVGCRAGLVGPERVYVDLAAIGNDDPVAAPEVAIPRPTAAAPRADPGARLVMPGRPAETIRDNGGPIRTSVEQIERDQQRAIADLNRRLREFYRLRVRRFREQRDAQSDAVKTDAYREATDTLTKAFIKYAELRGPMLASLAVISGWPDRGPRPNQDPQKMIPSARFFFLKAQSLRKEIAALDANFQTTSEGIMASAQGISDKEAAQALLEVSKFQDETNAKADAEAQEQVRSTPKELDIRLADAREIVLPEVRESAVTIGPMPPLPPAPVVPSSGIGNDAASRRRLIQHELSIWLSLRRYVAAARPKGVRDVTEEFRAWRKKLLSAGL